MHDKFKPVRKKGAYNATRTKKWDGKKWVPVNVVHKGQKATLNGKPVAADGKGNWRSPGTRGNSLEGTKPGKVKGSYQSGDSNRKPSTTSKPTKAKSSKNSYTVTGVEYDMTSGSSISKTGKDGTKYRSTYGYSIDPKTGKRTSNPKPKSTPTSSTPTRSTSTRSTPSRSTPTRSTTTSSAPTSSTPRTTTRTPQSKDMDANYKAWAKAHPALAKKVKKGQAGYEAIHGSTSSTPAAPKPTGAFKPGGTAKFPEGRRSTNKPNIGTNENPFKPSGSAKFPERTGSVLKAADKVPARQGVTKGIRAGSSTETKPVYGTGNHRGAGNGAPGAQRSSLKTTATKTKPTPAKPADKKPANQKPLTVPLNQIPKDLTGAAGRKYLADLDAGKLTRKRK